MLRILKLIYKQLHYYVHDCKDPRTDDFFLCGSPLKIISILIIYLYFVKKWGPKFMENRKPFQLNGVMMIYNFIQIVVNAILAVLGFLITLDFGYNNLFCLPSTLPSKQMYLFRLVHAYYLVKVFDLLDTVFFVLRKKYNQVSFLHVYHHIIISFSAYLAVQYIPVGQVTFQGLANVYVHTVMYFYYFYTSFKPELKQSLWWKKYITQFQMLQFFLVIIYLLLPIILNCNFPRFWLYMGIIQNLFMLAMFSDFYYKAYVKKRNIIKNN